MTPEERFTKIENFLSTVAEHQAQHAEQMAELRSQERTQHARHAEEIAELRQMQTTMAAGMIELQQDLKALAETVRANGEIMEERQRITEEKIHALIDTVDRIVRKRTN